MTCVSFLPELAGVDAALPVPVADFLCFSSVRLGLRPGIEAAFGVLLLLGGGIIPKTGTETKISKVPTRRDPN